MCWFKLQSQNSMIWKMMQEDQVLVFPYQHIGKPLIKTEKYALVYAELSKSDKQTSFYK